MSRLRLVLLAASAAVSVAAPALAQTAADEDRFRLAQQRYQQETQIYRQEQARYDAARRRSGRGYYGSYGGSVYNGGDRGHAPAYPRPDYPPQDGYAPQDAYAPQAQGGYAQPPRGDYAPQPQQGYAPQPGTAQREAGAGDRDENGYDPARDYRGGNYQERTLGAEERVYAGNDGRYYCKRPDGTTGLIIGGAAGGILGSVIQGGHSRVLGTLIGGAAGALAGKSIDQNSQVRCR